MKRKFIRYSRADVYAIFYMKERIIYYNLNFCGATKIYLMI